MRKLILTLSALFISHPALAANIECNGHEIEEYHILGEYGGSEIEMFDNDMWVPFKHTMDLESFPVQMVYNEQGAEKNTITIMGTTSADQKTTTALYRGPYGSVVNFTCTITD